jgi:hypothetical protein
MCTSGRTGHFRDCSGFGILVLAHEDMHHPITRISWQAGRHRKNELVGVDFERTKPREGKSKGKTSNEQPMSFSMFLACIKLDAQQG